jgi:hypothetical protein
MLYRILDPWRGRATERCVDQRAGHGIARGPGRRGRRRLRPRGMSQRPRAGEPCGRPRLATRTDWRARLLAARVMRTACRSPVEARAAAAAAEEIGMGAVERRSTPARRLAAAARTATTTVRRPPSRSSRGCAGSADPGALFAARHVGEITAPMGSAVHPLLPLDGVARRPRRARPATASHPVLWFESNYDGDVVRYMDTFAR